MKTDIHTIHYRGHKLTVILDHATALDLCVANEQSLEIPPGCNTVEIKFRDQAGNAVLAYRQTGFAPIQSDNEQEINGAGAIIIQNSDQLTDPQAAEILESFLEEALKS